MQEGPRAIFPAIAGRETVMEGADMRALVLTLAAGQNIPWHYHSSITDAFVCLTGKLVVETRAPCAPCAEPRRTLRRGADDGALRARRR